MNLETVEICFHRNHSFRLDYEATDSALESAQQDNHHFQVLAFTNNNRFRLLIHTIRHHFRLPTVYPGSMWRFSI